MNEADETPAFDIPRIEVAVPVFEQAVANVAKAAGRWKSHPSLATGTNLREAVAGLEAAVTLLVVTVPTFSAMANAEIDAVLGAQRTPDGPSPVSRLALPPADWAEPEAGEDPDVKWSR